MPAWIDPLTDSFEDRITYYQTRVDEGLDKTLPEAATVPERLHEAMRYAVFNGGKRLRPLLVYATGECLGVEADMLDSPAVAIELIHAFSLVHDDLPAMDDDDLRRGKPTLHVRFDEATAILAADALQPLAFSVLAGVAGTHDSARNALVRLVADAAGSTGMTGGQSIDLWAEGRTLSAAELEQMYSLKTGALIHASIMSACLLSDDLEREHVRALDDFGRLVGVAFQIKDDILDVVGETQVIGKPSGSDEKLRKATYPSLFGVKASRARCDELLEQALERLKHFGAAATPLEWLARYIVARGR
ncbi:MAG: polyprenyl synthetase family protein [Woeseiaceae bacterium]|nr:polyprenyl synthetase family protein [Woeseiaceae bacterium]